MLEYTIFRSACTGDAHGWETLELGGLSIGLAASRSGQSTKINMHVHIAADARALAAALIAAADKIDADFAEQEATNV